VIRERIDQKRGRISEYIRLLRDLQDDCLDRFATDPIYRGAMLHYLYLMADSCIALAQLVIKYKELRSPQSYSEAFDILGANHILDPDFAYKFARIAGFRNFLAHDYEVTDGQMICKALSAGLNEVEQYLTAIQKAMD
jgi:uncharacterized protein YutE (UPF0331/DUF86 family)